MSDFARGMLHVQLGSATTQLIVTSKAYGQHVYDRHMIEFAEARVSEIRAALSAIDRTIEEAKRDMEPQLLAAAE